MIKLFRQKSKALSEKEIYDLFAERMLVLCFRYIGNLMDAEEILHDGFIKVFGHMHKFEERHEKGFECWIKKIMVNECLMFLRKNHNFRLISMDEVNEKDLIKQDCPDSLDAESYFSVLNSLPVGYRTVFNLYAIEGYSHHEISEFLKITESTSRSQLSKARKMLQNKLLKQTDSLYA